MFQLSKWLRPQESEANAHGFNCAYLGVDKMNPYPPNTIDWAEYEWGWNEGIDLVNETNDVPITHPFSNEYGSEELT